MKLSDTILSPHEKLQLLNLIAKLPTTTRCADCVHMQGRFCELAGVAPPPEVMETGCEAWVFNPDSPPF